jgi:hypothetical protein
MDSILYLGNKALIYSLVAKSVLIMEIYITACKSRKHQIESLSRPKETPDTTMGTLTSNPLDSLLQCLQNEVHSSQSTLLHSPLLQSKPGGTKQKAKNEDASLNTEVDGLPPVKLIIPNHALVL